MSRDYEYQTQQSCALIDLDGPDQPFPGQRVLALSVGGRLIETVWSERERSFYDAWMAFPDVPAGVKAKQNARLMEAISKPIVFDNTVQSVVE